MLSVSSQLPLVLIDPLPQSKNVTNGTIVLLQCGYQQNPTLTPIWMINGNSYIPGDVLPDNHWRNSSGLVIQTQLSMDGSEYYCIYRIFLSNYNAFFQNNSNTALLNVYTGSKLKACMLYIVYVLCVMNGIMYPLWSGPLSGLYGCAL